jgi:hypothetical protein
MKRRLRQSSCACRVWSNGLLGSQSANHSAEIVAILPSDGRSIRVPYRNHIGVLIHAVAVEDDEGAVRVLAARNISGLTIPLNGHGGPKPPAC